MPQKEEDRVITGGGFPSRVVDMAKAVPAPPIPTPPTPPKIEPPAPIVEEKPE